MTIKPLAPILLTAVLLAGCASYQADVRRDLMQKAESSLAAAKSCCNDFSTMNFEDLSLDDSRKYAIDAKTPVFDFASGRSRFVALRLPDAKKFNLWITTYLHGGIHVNTSYIFYPSALLLDSSFRPIAVARNLTTEYRRGFLGPISWRGSIPIDREKLRAKYLVLFTDNNDSNGSVGFSQVDSTPIQYGNTFAVRNDARSYSVPFGKEGVLSVSFESDE